MCIADLTIAARAVAPSGRDNDVVTFLKSRRFGHGPADLVHNAGDFVTQRDRRRDVCVFAKIAVHKLHVGPAHPARPDPDENFIGLNVRNRHFLEDDSLAIFVHACCFHVAFLSKWWVFTIQVPLQVFGDDHHLLVDKFLEAVLWDIRCFYRLFR
jgi:hypothetical protein